MLEYLYIIKKVIYMITDENFIDLNRNFYTACKAKARIVTLLSVPTLLVLIVFLAYFNIIPLQMELHSLILISFVYFIYLFFVAHNAYYVSCKFKTQYKVLVKHLKEYINSNSLIIGGVSKANGSVDDFLKDFTSNIRNTNFSSVASGVFPTLGILGTFISIAFSMPDFTSNNQATLEKEISVLLNGVGTAFYISIYGIFLSLWWVFFEKIGISRFEHDTFLIKENTKSFFWTKLDIESIHIKNSLEHYEKIDRIFEQLTSQDLITNLQKNLNKRLIIIEDIVNKELILSKKIEENIKASETLSSSIDKLNTSSITNLQTLENKENKLIEINENLNSNIQNLKTSFESFDSQNLEKIYTNIVKSIETMKNDVDRIAWRFNQKLDDYDVNFEEKLKHSLEQIDEQTAKIIEDLTEFKNLDK